MATKGQQSVIGYVIYLNDAVVEYKTKTLKKLMESPCEAELRAIYNASKRARFYKYLLKFMGIPIELTILNDNTNAVLISNQARSIDEVGYMDNKYLVVSRFVEKGEFNVSS
jgi:hypothetical protein